MQKVLNLSYLKTIEGNNNDEIDGLLDNLPKHELEKTDWLVLKKVPKVSFAMAYNIDYIFVKFYVEEPYFKCDYLKIHDPVFEDSCVELFLRFNSDENYYNLEFNALGTCLAAYGSNRHDREKLPIELVEKIHHSVLWKPYLPEDNMYKWFLTLSIPLSVFCYNDCNDFRGKKAQANFYKCGDCLPEPHYLVWNKVRSDFPDFHLPQFFGCLNFLDEDGNGKGDVS